MSKDNICTGIPVQATMIKVNGKYVIDYTSEFTKCVDIPADVIARFLIKQHGITPVHKGGDNING